MQIFGGPLYALRDSELIFCTLNYYYYYYYYCCCYYYYYYYYDK